MATMLPMRGTSEMEVFAAKQLKKRVPELNEAFRTAGQEVQAKLRPEFTAVMQAVVKHDKNPEDCPLMSGDLLRVVMTLKNKIERNKAITMSPQHVAAKKPSLESSSSTKRELPVGSRGPHPLVTAALRKKQKRKRDKDSDTEEAEEEDEAEEEAEVEVEVVPEPAPRETPKEEIKCKSKPLQPPEEPPPDDTPAIKIPKIEEVNEVKIETPKESPAHPPHPSPGSSPASFAIPVLPVCNMRIRGAQVTAPSVDGYPGRFDVQNEKGWKQFLQVHGWVIVGPVATVTEIEQMKNNFWEYREAMGTNINRNIPETWSNDAWGGNYNTGFWCSHGAGQEQWMWDLREKCYPVFKTLYRTDELFTSFEGFSACRKSTPVKPGIWKIDQDPKELKFQCFQGAMSLLDSGPYDAGLCVGDGSRRSFQQFAELKDKSTKVIPSQHQYDLIQNPLKLCYKKGDLILWDSRVATCLQPSSDTSQPDLASLHGCVCMVPLASATRSNPDPSRLTAQQKAWRRQCIEEGRTTTHHVWLNQTEKISSSRRTGLPIMSLASYTPPKLSDLQIRMAGIYCRSEGRPKAQLYRTDTRDVRPQESKKIRPKQSARRTAPVDSLGDVVGRDVQLPYLLGSTNKERFYAIHERLSAMLRKCYIDNYSSSSRRMQPEHLQLLLEANVSDTTAALEAAAVQFVINTINDAQSALKEEHTAADGEVTPICMTELEQVTHGRVLQRTKEVTDDPSSVARLLEKSIQK